MPKEKLVLIDVDIQHWTVKETRLYREAVGVNPMYAMGVLSRAANESAAEAKALFGDADPPEDWLPLPLFNIDPGYLLGFAWMAARRKDKALAFDDYEGTIETGELMRAFYGGADEVAAPAPLEEPVTLKPRKNSSAPKSPSDSASSLAAGA